MQGAFLSTPFFLIYFIVVKDSLQHVIVIKGKLFDASNECELYTTGLNWQSFFLF